MDPDTIKTVSVLGAGIMGHGIAQRFIMGGYGVMLLDIRDSILDTAAAHIRENLELFAREGLIDEGEIEPALRRLHPTLDLKEAVATGDFVMETVTEDLALKQDLFARVASLSRGGTVITTNTSSFTLKAIGKDVPDKSRLAVTHWFNPPHIVPTVEVVKGEETSDETVETACRLLEKIGKVPVRLRFEMPGFLINRIQTAMVREVFDLYGKGMASAEDIDKAVRGSIGFRLASIGPLLTVDLGGAELWLKVVNNLLPQISRSIDPPAVLEKMVAQGHYGIKTGKGFYDYASDFSKTELDCAVRKRDQEFVNRLKHLYSDTLTGKAPKEER